MIENKVYSKLRDFVKEHHGFGAQDFEEHPEIKKEYDEFMAQLRVLEGKKIKLVYRYSAEFTGHIGEKIGKIKLEGEKIKFYEGRKRTRFNYLDAGLFDGWFATLIPLTIEQI